MAYSINIPLWEQVKRASLTLYWERGPFFHISIKLCISREDWERHKPAFVVVVGLSSGKHQFSPEDGYLFQNRKRLLPRCRVLLYCSAPQSVPGNQKLKFRDKKQRLLFGSEQGEVDFMHKQNFAMFVKFCVKWQVTLNNYIC